MAESKDQRRTRLKNEGKALLAEGRHSEITPQHQAAMDYFARKNASKGAKEKAANAAKKVEAGAPELLSKASQTYVPDPVAKMGKEKTELFKGSIFEPKSRVLSINPRAVNEDHTHHAMMGSLLDALSEKLDESHDNGSLLAQNAKHIDDRLSIAYQHLHKSNNAHERGDVEGAKDHMHKAADAAYSTATQMASKGIKLHPTKNIPGLALEIARGYSGSKVPGEGAMPHEGFRKKVSRYTVAGHIEEKAEAAAPQTTSKDIGRLSKSFEEDHSDTDWNYGESREPEATTGSVMSQQLQSYFRGGN